jgi:hypothetical protein
MAYSLATSKSKSVISPQLKPRNMRMNPTLNRTRFSSANQKQREKGYDIFDLAFIENDVGRLDRVMDSRDPGPYLMTGKRHQEKAKQLFDLIWGKEDMLTLFSRTKSFAERVTGSAAQVIQAEVDVLPENTRFFGKYDSATSSNADEMDFNEAVYEVKSNTPNLTQIVTIASESGWGHCKKEPSSVPLTLIASILSTRRAKRWGNFLARSLGVYMYTSGVPRRVISILYRNLELLIAITIHTILHTVKGIATNTE